MELAQIIKGQRYVSLYKCPGPVTLYPYEPFFLNRNKTDAVYSTKIRWKLRQSPVRSSLKKKGIFDCELKIIICRYNKYVTNTREGVTYM